LAVDKVIAAINRLCGPPYVWYRSTSLQRVWKHIVYQLISSWQWS